MGGRALRLFFLRLSATIFDLLLGIGLGFLLSNSTIGSFFADRAVVMLKIGSRDTLWKGTLPMIMGVLGPFVYVLPLSILLILSTEAFTGTSPGKKILRLEILGGSGAPPSKKLLFGRCAARTVFFSGLLVALLSGHWILALCSSVLGFALFCNMVLSLFSTVRPIHEILSQTRLARRT